jgi:hypothetical protein
VKDRYILKTLTIFLFASGLVYAGFIAKTFYQGKEKKEFYRKTALFFKPRIRKPSARVVRVEIEVFDELATLNGKIMEINFNGKKLQLQPPDPTGSRGSVFFQVYPGEYLLKWSVRNRKYAWPRYSKYRRYIQVGEKDLWVHIRIEGKRIFIS